VSLGFGLQAARKTSASGARNFIEIERIQCIFHN
jgi:hypothetical protein